MCERLCITSNSDDKSVKAVLAFFYVLPLHTVWKYPESNSIKQIYYIYMLDSDAISFVKRGQHVALMTQTRGIRRVSLHFTKQMMMFSSRPSRGTLWKLHFEVNVKQYHGLH